MKRRASFSNTDKTLTVRVPLAIRKRGGRRIVLTPQELGFAMQRARVDNNIRKALARAFRWRSLLETGAYLTIEDLASAERINPSYVSRIVRLTLLAPDIVESILDGRVPSSAANRLMRPLPVEWAIQRQIVLPE